MTFQDIVNLHPRPTSVDRDALLRCIEECIECAASCVACADASLGEDDLPHLVRVIRLCLDCSDMCEVTSRVVTRQTTPDLRIVRAIVEACGAVCEDCAEECERHASHHEHCRICAEVCHRCEQACDDLLASLPG